MAHKVRIGRRSYAVTDALLDGLKRSPYTVQIALCDRDKQLCHVTALCKCCTIFDEVRRNGSKSGRSGKIKFSDLCGDHSQHIPRLNLETAVCRKTPG